MSDRAPVWDVERSRARGNKRWSAFTPDVLDLGVAEMDVAACPPVRDAVRAVVDAEGFGYPVPDQRSEVPRAVAQWLGNDGLFVDPADVRLVPDVMRGIGIAIRRLTRPGSPVLVPTPSYQRFFEIVPAFGRECVEIPLLLDDGAHRLDLDAVESGLAAGAGSVLLCNPVNPTGAVLDHAQLLALSDLVERHGARVIADEIHAPIRYGTPFVPYAAINAQARAHAVTVTSATKAWNFPGLRAAFVVLTGPGDGATWSALPHVESSGVSPLGMVATVAALDHGRPWLDAVVRDLGVHRDLVLHDLDAAGLGEICRRPGATYFAWLDLRAWGRERPGAWLLDEVGVALGEGANYGAAGAGFVRLNFATPPAVLSDAVARIAKVLGA
ncbi:MalY/PatB family protein [Pseudonocardia sp. TRM90224]|uniref:MalY/PatB family protein n=1 Tax=Pseudonocardia sp. TRM90224 TaxID=2812678 RepID=UPI001E3FEBB2|nr:aminotransferase class I/II-fold pyridoxal phosphate-dependent enzyme [Pseudonocardia sp. TRM90224]